MGVKESKSLRISSNSSFKYETDNCMSLFLPVYGCEGKIHEKSFIIDSIISNGAFGDVLKVKCLLDNTMYAMKMMKKSQLIENDAIQQAKDEATIQESVSFHKRIVKTFWFFQNQESIFIVMEYLPGGELFEFWKNKRYFEEKNVKIYIAEMALVLEFLHDFGIIYRDLKLENILLDSRGHLKLTDFGLAKRLRKGQRTRTICGTLHYIAPEIARGGLYGHNSDWWSLGILTYILLVGQFPLTGVTSHLEMFALMSTTCYTVPSTVTFEQGSSLGHRRISAGMRDLTSRLLELDEDLRLASSRGLEEHPTYKGFNFMQLQLIEMPLPMNSQDSFKDFDVENNFSNSPQIYLNDIPPPVAQNKKIIYETNNLLHTNSLNRDKENNNRIMCEFLNAQNIKTDHPAYFNNSNNKNANNFNDINNEARVRYNGYDCSTNNELAASNHLNEYLSYQEYPKSFLPDCPPTKLLNVYDRYAQLKDSGRFNRFMTNVNQKMNHIKRDTFNSNDEYRDEMLSKSNKKQHYSNVEPMPFMFSYDNVGPNDLAYLNRKASLPDDNGHNKNYKKFFGEVVGDRYLSGRGDDTFIPPPIDYSELKMIKTKSRRSKTMADPSSVDNYFNSRLSNRTPYLNGNESLYDNGASLLLLKHDEMNGVDGNKNIAFNGSYDKKAEDAWYFTKSLSRSVPKNYNVNVDHIDSQKYVNQIKTTESSRLSTNHDYVASHNRKPEAKYLDNGHLFQHNLHGYYFN